MANRLLNSEVDKRVVVKLNKSIAKDDAYSGLMTFGTDNDYPQLTEKIILGSPTAKSTANMYARFLTGLGFENEAINEQVIGRDARGKEITIKSLLRQTAMSIAFHNGYYWHTERNLRNEVGDVRLVPFKDCRFSKPDDTGYSSRILRYDNWAKDAEWKKYDKNLIADYNVFSSNAEITSKQIEKVKGAGNYRGQIYFQFLDNQYFYPLSPFDSSYLDCDTEQQIALFKNRQIRDGFLKKIVMRIAPSGTEEERQDFVDFIYKTLGPDGQNVLVLEDEVDENGNINEASAFKIDTVDSNVDDKLFENWEKNISNSIRKSANNIPKLLIDIEDNIFSGQSGESIKQATAFFNAMTDDDRSVISNSFKEVFSLSNNPVLRENQNWEIQRLELVQEVEEVSVDEADQRRLEAQATLKGSVGGVTALITLQQSVASGASDLGAAVEIVKVIYGIDEETARRMIGTPKEEPLTE